MITPGINKFLEKHLILVLSVLFLIALGPLMAQRDFTPSNELRYLNIADEALQGGNLFAFTNQGEPYADKPPLYIWMIMLCKLIFGRHSMFALSLFSFIPAFGIIWIMDRWLRETRPSVTVRDRAAAALMLGSSALFLGMSVFLRMDMLLCFFITASLYVFHRRYRGLGNPSAQDILLPVFIFLALFTKGPVGLMVPPLAIIVYLAVERRIREAGKYIGWKTWGIIAGLSALWFTGVWFDGGKDYLNNLLFHQTVDRAVNAFHHKEPFWYYAVAIWYIMAPYSLMTVPVSFAGSFGKRQDSTEKLFSSVFIPTFILLSLFSSKLAIYLAPVIPFMTYFTFMKASDTGSRKWFNVSLAIPEAILALAGIAVVAGLSIGNRMPAIGDIADTYPFISSPFIYAGAIILAVGFVTAILTLFLRKSWKNSIIVSAATMLAFVFSVSFEMKQANDFIGFGNLSDDLIEWSGNTGMEKISDRTDIYTMFIYRPENMSVYLGCPVKNYGEDSERFISEAPSTGYLIIMTEDLSGSEDLFRFLENRQKMVSGPYTVYKL